MIYCSASICKMRLMHYGKKKGAEIHMSDGIDVYRDTWREVPRWSSNCLMSFNKEQKHNSMSVHHFTYIFQYWTSAFKIHCLPSIQELGTKQNLHLLQTISPSSSEIKKSPSLLIPPSISCLPALAPLPSLRHWPSEPRVRPERGLCDLQLCLLSTQTSVRTAGRERKGQTVERHECT